jgi:iron complex outermembrane receptor protein
MFKKTRLSSALMVAFGSTASLSSLPVLAQDSTQRVEITGSAIKRINAETALPVTVLKVDELKQQGFTSVEQLVNTIAGNQSFTGTSGAIGAVTGGASFANLRGLGQNKTLVLLNGRRIANSAIGGAGDSSAPDLNTIPLAAIDRIEVLRDGASSLYGTDAIGGVINFITKVDYTGAEASVQYTSPQHSGGKSYEVSAGFGRGDLAADKWNVFGFIDFQHQDVLTTPQRPSFATSTKTSPTGFPGGWSQGDLAGNPFAPACNQQFQAPGDATSCNYYYWNWVDLIPKTDRINGMLKGTVALSNNSRLSAEYTAAKTDVWTNIAPVPEGNLTMYPFNVVNGVSTGVPNPYYPAGADPTSTANPGVIPGSIRVRYRTIPAGPRADHNETLQQRLVTALEGSFAGWDYNTGLSYNKIKTTDTLINGYVDDNVLRELVASGKLNPFNTVDQLSSSGQLGLIQGAVLPGRLFDSTGTVYGWDGKISRELADWFGAGRPTALALGAEWRHEKYTQIAAGLGDPNSYPNKVVSSTGFDPNTDNEGSRNVWALYGELNMPIIKSLEITASLRYDKYPDFGSTTNPKLAFRFQPGPTWLARGSVATGFRAPSLFELHSAQVFTNTANNWNDPVRCPGGNPIPGASRQDNCQVQFMALTGGNPKLTPEKSKSATVGLVFQPVADFDASIDFWWVKLKNSIGSLADTTVFGDPANFASHFVRAADGSLASDGSLCNTAANPGPRCGFVVLLNDNLGGVRTNGIDLAANYRLRSAMGNWTFRFNETYVNKYKFQTERNGPWSSAVGVYSNIPNTTGGAPVFRNQFTLAVNWEMGPWAAGLVNHYKSGYLDSDVGQTPVERVASYSTWDLFGSWAPNKQLTITAGVKNLLDTKPPHSEQAATFQVGFDPRFTDPLLRAYYLRLGYKF